MLLTCENKDIRDKLIQDKWLQKWFGEVKKWNGEAASLERFAWIDLVGLPLDIWSLKTFKSIGELWGHFISASNDALSDFSFSKASMLVATDAKNKIDEWIWVEVQGREFEVRAMEGSSFHALKSLMEHLALQTSYCNSGVVGNQVLAGNKDGTTNYVLGHGENSEQLSGKDSSFLSKHAHVDHIDVVVDSQVDSSLRIPESIGLCGVKDVLHAHAEEDIGVIQSHDEEAQSLGAIINNKDFFGADKDYINGLVEDSNQSNSWEEEDADLADTNKDKEVVEFDQGFWNLSEVGFLNEKDVEGIQLVVDLNPADVVKDTGKGKWKQKRIGEMRGFPKSKKKGCQKKKKCVVLIYVIAVAALSVSSEGINRIHLNISQASRSISKILGEDFLGDDDDVISSFSVAS